MCEEKVRQYIFKQREEILEIFLTANWTIDTNRLWWNNDNPGRKSYYDIYLILSIYANIKRVERERYSDSESVWVDTRSGKQTFGEYCMCIFGTVPNFNYSVWYSFSFSHHRSFPDAPDPSIRFLPPLNSSRRVRGRIPFLSSLPPQSCRAIQLLFCVAMVVTASMCFTVSSRLAQSAWMVIKSVLLLLLLRCFYPNGFVYNNNARGCTRCIHTRITWFECARANSLTTYSFRDFQSAPNI